MSHRLKVLVGGFVAFSAASARHENEARPTLLETDLGRSEGNCAKSRFHPSESLLNCVRGRPWGERTGISSACAVEWDAASSFISTGGGPCCPRNVRIRYGCLNLIRDDGKPELFSA